MPDSPIQPGRIEPLQSIAKSSNPADAATNAIGNAVTARFSDEDNKNRYRKALKKARITGRVPTFPKYRVSKVEGTVLIAITIVIDIVEFIAGLFAEVLVGEVVCIIIDVIVGIVLIAYCAVRLRMSIAAHWQRYASILGAFIGEALPVINIASFWTLDVWYILHTIRAEDRAAHQQVLDTMKSEQEEEDRQEWMRNYARQQQREEEEDTRQPVEEEQIETQ